MCLLGCKAKCAIVLLGLPRDLFSKLLKICVKDRPMRCSMLRLLESVWWISHEKKSRNWLLPRAPLLQNTRLHHIDFLWLFFFFSLNQSIQICVFWKLFWSKLLFFDFVFIFHYNVMFCPRESISSACLLVEDLFCMRPKGAKTDMDSTFCHNTERDPG